MAKRGKKKPVKSKKPVALSAGKGLNKPMSLSEEMSDFIGKGTASRAEITKKIWTHVKKMDLQDPDDKRMVIPDETLEPILGHRPISMFKIATKVSDHVFDE